MRVVVVRVEFSMLLWSALLLSSAPTQATDKEHTASCADLHPRCFGWAQRGLCTELWEFMHADCTASCGACTEAALTKDPCAPRAEGDLQAPGSLRAAFDRAAGHVQLEPTLHSAEPPIVTLDGFMSADEAAEVVRVAEAIGFHPSGSGCGGNRALCNMGYIHCDESPACRTAPAMSNLAERMRELLHVPLESTESLGLFRYEPGHTFRYHHDQVKAVVRDSPGGPRVWASYVFLSEVETGGEFRLPLLNISISPKPGRALMWPHLRDDDLLTPDERTYHEGAPVVAGVKYAAVLMAHRSDFRTRVLSGCPIDPLIAHNFARDRTHASPLRMAAAEGRVEMVRRLLASNAPIDGADGNGRRPLHEAATQGHLSTMRLLLDAGADSEATDEDGETPLHSAVIVGQAASVRLLVERGARLDAKNKGGSSPLHIAAVKGQTAAARVLLELGAPVDLADAYGAAPLHVAAAFGHMDTVRVLCEHGASLELKMGTHGPTARGLAHEQRHAEVARMLQQEQFERARAKRKRMPPATEKSKKKQQEQKIKQEL